MGNKFIRFMSGRYGVDKLYWWLFGSSLVLFVLRTILQRVPVLPYILWSLAVILLAYALFRVFSSNKMKRAAENRAFCAFLSKITAYFKVTRDRIKYRKTAVFRRCPHCGSWLKLPKKAGEHTVKCPRCSERFDVKI